MIRLPNYVAHRSRVRLPNVRDPKTSEPEFTEFAGFTELRRGNPRGCPIAPEFAFIAHNFTTLAFLIACLFASAFAQGEYEGIDSLPPPPAAVEAAQDTAVQDTAAQDTAALVAVAVAVPKQCARTYNINELMFKLKDGFPKQLKDCATKLAKDMLTPASLGGKKLEPKSFMMQCPVDGIKKELPDGFPGADRLIGSLANFVQGLLNSAMAGGGLDPKKLISAVAGMDINGLLSDAKKLASGECVVNEPYTPPAVPEGKLESEGESGSGDKKDKGTFLLGFRAGFNFSHLYETYNDMNGSYNSAIGFQGGLVFDIALSDVFRLQPGIMFIKKGAEYGKYELAQYYLECPLLVSLKLWALRLNAGPYFSVGGSKTYGSFDLGLSFGGGFDIGSFYIGTFYDYGLTDISKVGYISTHNCTLGFNLGYNI